jgi:hypothetical protein
MVRLIERLIQTFHGFRSISPAGCPTPTINSCLSFTFCEHPNRVGLLARIPHIEPQSDHAKK